MARFGERRTAHLGLGVGSACALGYAVAPEGRMVFPLIAVGSLQGIAAIAGPPPMTGVFSLATRPGSGLFWPGAPYAAAAALLAVTLGVLIWKTSG